LYVHNNFIYMFVMPSVAFKYYLRPENVTFRGTVQSPDMNCNSLLSLLFS